jgi:uncharacterized protein YutE (UPF0331/DUF86 family)
LVDPEVFDRRLAKLVHLYLEVDPTRIHAIVTNELDQLEAFAAAVSRS